jgi:hypothetical protein
MFEVQEALDAQKEEFARREDAFRRREEALRKKDLELQESLIKFNKFLQENESKRNRAIKRAADEKKQRELKEIEIEKLTKQYLGKKVDEKAMKQQVQQNIKYQQFLTDVVDHVQGTSEDFPEVQDLLNRYEREPRERSGRKEVLLLRPKRCFCEVLLRGASASASGRAAAEGLAWARELVSCAPCLLTSLCARFPRSCRYKTLRDANEDLNKRQGSQDRENDEKRHYFSQITKDRANEVLNRNNEIAMLQKHLESCSVGTLQMQNNVDSSIRDMSDKVLQLGQMLASIENLLERFETQARHIKRSKVRVVGEGGGGGEGRRAHTYTTSRTRRTPRRRSAGADPAWRPRTTSPRRARRRTTTSRTSLRT